MQGKKQSSAGIRSLAHFFLLHFGRVLSWTLKVLRCPCIWLMKPNGKEQPWEQVYSSSCYRLKSRIAGLLKLWMKRKQKHPHPQGGVRCPVPCSWLGSGTGPALVEPRGAPSPRRPPALVGHWQQVCLCWNPASAFLRAFSRCVLSYMNTSELTKNILIYYSIISSSFTLLLGCFVKL